MLCSVVSSTRILAFVHSDSQGSRSLRRPHTRLSDWSSIFNDQGGVWYEPIEKSTTCSDEGRSSFGRGQKAEDVKSVK